MRKNKLKQMFKNGEPIINGWLQIPSAFSAEVMAHQGWDSCTIDMQHGVVDYPNALGMLQALSTTDVTPLARVNWNEPGQIMKILDAGCYGVICPMVSNRKEAENFVQACLYPSKGYRSFGPIRGLLYGGSDYAKHADNEILKLAMIETKEALEKLDEILDTPENTIAYKEILRILEAANKRNLLAGIHNGTAEYAQKMISKGFNLVTVGSDQRFMSGGAKVAIEKIKGKQKKEESKGY